MLLLFYSIFGLVACFIGALAFRANNLSVVSISVRKLHRQGVLFLLGASLVEILKAHIAVALVISSFQTNSLKK